MALMQVRKVLRAIGGTVFGRRAALAMVLVLLMGALLASRDATGAVPSGPDGPGVLTLTDGRTLEGDITERTDQIAVDVNGIITTVPRSQVASIEYGTLEQRLRRRLQAAETSDDRLAIGDQALGRGLLDLAQEIAQDVRDREPANMRALRLLDLIEQQRQLQRASGQGPRRGERPPTTSRVLRPTVDNVLNEAQINRIRQAELQDADVRGRTRISFRDGVLKRFTEGRANLDFRAFNGLDDVSKALFILQESRDEEIREDIWITSHPVALLDYVRRVEPIILSGCATSECHGGAAAAAFALYGTARDEAISYTNFYILSTGVAAVPPSGGGVFGEAEAAPVGRLIDRIRPEESLLLKYMLPRDKTNLPHPAVKNFNGLVLNTGDQHYQIVRQWIVDVLPPLPALGYGFDFRLQLPATSPATGPAPDAPQSQPPQSR